VGCWSIFWVHAQEGYSCILKNYPQFSEKTKQNKTKQNKTNKQTKKTEKKQKPKNQNKSKQNKTKPTKLISKVVV
jgi:Zn-finger protein